MISVKHKSFCAKCIVNQCGNVKRRWQQQFCVITDLENKRQKTHNATQYNNKKPASLIILKTHTYSLPKAQCSNFRVILMPSSLPVLSALEGFYQRGFEAELVLVS